MKNLIYLFLAFIFISCSKADKTTPKGSEKTKETAAVTPNESTKDAPKSPDANDPNKNVYGYYTGEFKALKYDESKDISFSNRITISIDKISGNEISGHSVVAGNYRPFKGTATIRDKNILVEAAEPGDEKYDGNFTFTIFPGSNDIKGTWRSVKKDIDVTEREYALNKQDFKYNADLKLPDGVAWTFLYDKNAQKFESAGEKGESLTEDVIKVNASKKLLTKSDVENMHKGDLEIIRNSIYARHGYSFKNRRIRFVFDSFVDWYMPVSTDVSKDLTEVEQKNIDLLKRYEQHAEKYYDDFGR